MSKRDDLEIVIGADLSGLASDLNRAAQMAKGAAAQIERHAPRSKDFTPNVDPSGLNRATRAAKEAGGGFRSAAADLAGFAAKVAITGGTLIALEAGLSGVGSAMQHVKESVAMAAELEQTSLAFEVMLGSAREATEMLGNLRQFAAETPFGSKETIGAARQLKAYGIEADQIIPTLRVLGDITSGLGGETNLKDMSYLFGTLASQGRAFSKDIYQFTNRGVDLLPGLAAQFGVTKSEVMGLVEEGRVGFPQVGRALQALTGPGGQFNDLMKRQSKTLAGLWEQAQDAFDLGKIKFGQIIIEETGLKEATRDLDAFAKRVTAGLDSTRPFVRLIGDLVKGGAQIAYEFGRAGVEIASLNLDGLARSSPEIAQLVKNIQDVVAGLKDFKLDKRALAGFGVGLFEMIVYPLADIADWVNTDGKEFADGIRDNFVKPIQELKNVVKEFREKGFRGVVNEAWMNEATLKAANVDLRQKRDTEYLKERGIDLPGSPIQVGYGVDVLKATDDMPFFNPPRADEPVEQVVARFRHLESTINKAKWLERFDIKDFIPHRQQLETQRGEFLRPFSHDPGGELDRLRQWFAVGKAPPRRADWVDIPPPGARAGGVFKTRRERLEESVKQFSASVDAGLMADDIRGHFGKMFADIRATEQARNTAAQVRESLSPLALSAALGPFGELAGPVRDLDRQLKSNAFGALGGGIAGLAVTRETFSGSEQLRFKNEPTSTHAEIAKSIREKYDPLAENGKLMSYRKNLTEARDFGLITPQQFDLGWRDAVQELAGKFGLNQPARLPDTVLAGSEADARLLAQAMGGQQQKTTEDLLRDIRGFLESIARSNSRIEQAPAPRPVNVSVPGGGN